MNGCVALMYHVIDEPRSVPERQWCCTPDSFRAQMQLLHDSGYNVVSMSQLVSWLEGRAELPGNAVCITIDDGTRCIVDAALPVLSAFSFPAIAYVVSGRLGAENDWLQEVGWAPRPLVDVPDLLDLVREGVEIGSHSVTHADLSVAAPALILQELSDSKARFEDALGMQVAHFAYPLGRLTKMARDAVEHTGYRSACTVEDGRIRRGDDRYRLNRVEIYHWDTLDVFARKVRWAAADAGFNLATVRRLARRTLKRAGLYDSLAIGQR
jgi:peptidoglycan/xylan/chitin deacetylase (PgdA/CDA1 family)